MKFEPTAIVMFTVAIHYMFTVAIHYMFTVAIQQATVKPPNIITHSEAKFITHYNHTKNGGCVVTKALSRRGLLIYRKYMLKIC